MAQTEMPAAHRKAQPRGPLKTALWMWFAAVGGAVSWALHLAAAWGITETTCLSGHSRIGQLPLTSVVGLVTVVPLAITVLATVAAWWMWHQTASESVDDTTAAGGRARLIAGVGLAANLLFTSIIVFDGIALMVFPPCLR